MPGQGEKHVIKRGPAERQAVRLHTRAIQAAHDLDQRLRAGAADAHADDTGLGLDVRLTFADVRDRGDRVGDPGPVGYRELDDVPADPALQLLSRASGDDQAAVDYHDLVGQFVGLVKVLSG